MPIFKRLFAGSYGEGNWEYLARHGGKQLLTREQAHRPFWLAPVYVAMMSLCFWNGGLGLPWYTKYLLQICVIGLAALFLLITGDFGRWPAIGEYYVIFVIPFIMMACWSMLIWALDFRPLNYMSRGCSTILYHIISLTSVCAATYLFGGKVIDLTLYGMCGANTFILLDSIKTFGVGSFITGFIAFVKSGGVDTNVSMKALEIHDLTFGFGLMVLYYLLFEKGKKRATHLPLAALFFYLGLKRIALIGMAGVILMHLFVTRLKPKAQNFLLHTISIFAIAVCFFYVFFIHSGLFNWVVTTFDIDTMGRDGLYAAFTDLYSFTPWFRGYGIGWVTRYISIQTAQGIGIFGTHDFGGMHNDIVTMYIELGFWGFAFWIWLSWQGKIVWCQKAHGTKTAFLLLYCTIYAFVTYATDNTAFYCYINTVFMLLPIGYAMKQQDANEGNDNHVETQKKQTTKPSAEK